MNVQAPLTTVAAEFSGKTVLVTGGRTGFLGTNFTKTLLAAGATVYAHARTLGQEGFLPAGTPNMREFYGDLTQIASMPEGIDLVIHCAAHTSGAHEMATNPVAQVTPNLFMNSLTLDAAARAKVKKFVFISSSAIYPRSLEPLAEDMGFSDDPPGNYFGPAWMKRYCEKIGKFYSDAFGMEVLVIRPSNVYGPYSSFDPIRSHVLPALIRKFVEKQTPLEVWGTPDVVRDFIYVDDFIRGVLVATQAFSGHDIFNIATGNPVTIGESVELIKELTGYEGPVSFNSDKPMTIDKRTIDPAKAKAKLGFETEISFREGMRRTIDWYVGTLAAEKQA